MPDDETRQRIHLGLLTLVRSRVAFALQLEPTDLSEMTLGKALNLLFLLRGQTQELGEYMPSLTAIYALIGVDAVWVPQAEKKAVVQ